MTKPKPRDWARLQVEFNVYGGSLREFCEEKGINYGIGRAKLRDKERKAFQNEITTTTRQMLVSNLSDEVAKKLRRHWKLTEIIEGKILQELQLSAVEAKSLEQLLRVLQDNIRLQRLILGEPDLITQEGPKSPYEAFIAKHRVQDAEVEEVEPEGDDDEQDQS